MAKRQRSASSSGGIQTRNWVDKKGVKQSRVIVKGQAFKSSGATAGGKAKYRQAGASKNKSNGGAGG